MLKFKVEKKPILFDICYSQKFFPANVREHYKIKSSFGAKKV